MFILFLSAFGLGLAFCAPPGSVTAEALRRGFARGFGSALAVEVGSLIGDATWAAIALVGASFLVQNAVARTILGLIGAFLLFRLGWNALRDARTGQVPAAAPASGRGDFAVGAFMSLTNPLTIGFWVGVGGGAVASIVPNPTSQDFAVFYMGFMLACVAWCFLFSGLIAFCRSLLRPRLFQAINLVCGLALVYFSLRLFVSAVLVA